MRLFRSAPESGSLEAGAAAGSQPMLARSGSIPARCERNLQAHDHPLAAHRAVEGPYLKRKCRRRKQLSRIDRIRTWTAEASVPSRQPDADGSSRLRPVGVNDGGDEIGPGVAVQVARSELFHPPAGTVKPT